MIEIDAKKLVISDMDGTLLKNDKTISQFTINTVLEMKEKGIDFTIATGRIYPTVLTTVKKMGITKPLVLCNGAIIQDSLTKEVYFSKNIEKSKLISILEMILKTDIFFYFYTMDTLVCKELNYTAKVHFENNKELDDENKLKLNIVEDVISLAKDLDVYKIVIIDQDVNKIKKLREDLKIYFDFVEIYSSNWDNMEIVAKGVSKGEAVKILADMLSYDLKDVMCIGDEENDETMLSECGFAVAMGNGSEKVKSMADFVTDDNENDGVGKAIREFAKI